MEWWRSEMLRLRAELDEARRWAAWFAAERDWIANG